MSGFCRDCLADTRDGAMRCRTCGSPRLARHAEIETLSIAPIDCEAFYATVEKRDRGGVARPVGDGGGGTRGMAACYIARTFGIRPCRCSRRAAYARMP